MQDADRKVWDEVWSSMPHKRLVTFPPDLKDWFGYDFGGIAAATISRVPEQYIDQMYFSGELCPVCGNLPESAKRIPISVNAKFVGNLKLGLFTWAHFECFDSCPLEAEPPPIPW
jgi:hypothetical protein